MDFLRETGDKNWNRWSCTVAKVSGSDSKTELRIIKVKGDYIGCHFYVIKIFIFFPGAIIYGYIRRTVHSVCISSPSILFFFFYSLQESEARALNAS